MSPLHDLTDADMAMLDQTDAGVESVEVLRMGETSGTLPLDTSLAGSSAHEKSYVRSYTD